MNCFIYLEIIGEVSYNYHKDMIVWLRSELSDVRLYDMDNFSDELVKSNAIQMVGLSKKTMLYIMIKEGGAGLVNASLGLIEQLMKGGNIMQVVLNGESKYIKVLARQYKADCHQGGFPEDEKKIISDFYLS